MTTNSVVRQDVPVCSIVGGFLAKVIKINNKSTEEWENK